MMTPIEQSSRVLGVRSPLEAHQMSMSFPYFLSGLGEELQVLRRNWGCYLALGIALIVVGILAIGSPVVATLVSVEIIALLLLVGATVELGSAIWSRGWGGFFLHLLSGLLYLFLGLAIMERPALGAGGYTLLMAMFFIAIGLFRIVVALGQRFSGWGWTIVSGFVSFSLGVMIWRDFPASAYWVIGTFVGIELVFNGISWVMLGLAARRIPAGETKVDELPKQLVRV